MTKSIDPERPVIVNGGWEHTISDIITLHDYEELGEVFYERYKDKDPILNNEISHNNHKYAFADCYEYKDQPVMLTEMVELLPKIIADGDMVTSPKNFNKSRRYKTSCK
ncbi:hypothetical protein [Gracilibacillus salitolerans]|uniref:hypothetical protein n=1 Tax=Gracilibacillus salitolerans TaxID=2663022 RepID=UPI0038996985